MNLLFCNFEMKHIIRRMHVSVDLSITLRVMIVVDVVDKSSNKYFQISRLCSTRDNTTQMTDVSFNA